MFIWVFNLDSIKTRGGDLIFKLDLIDVYLRSVSQYVLWVHCVIAKWSAVPCDLDVYMN